MDGHEITFAIQPPRFARRGVAMFTPVACYTRIPRYYAARAALNGPSAITHDFHWTITIRNLRNFQITELDVDQNVYALTDDEVNGEHQPDSDIIRLFKFIHCVVPADTRPGHYTMDFVLWTLCLRSNQLVPTGAASSRVFEVIVKDDAPLDALTAYERQVIMTFDLERSFNLPHLRLNGTPEPEGSFE